MAKIVALIPTLPERKELLDACLEALERWPEVTPYIGRRGYFTENVNALLELAFKSDKEFEYVWILNDDTIPLEGCVEHSLGFFDRVPHCGAIGHRNMDYEDHTRTNYAGPPQNAYYRIESGWLPPNPDEVRTVPWYAFSSIMFRKQAMQEVGILNKVFLHSRSDSEYCLRVRSKGWDICYLPSAKVAHKWHTPPNVQGELSRIAITDDDNFLRYTQILVTQYVGALGMEQRRLRLDLLTEIAEHYGTDKGFLCDANGRVGHLYTPFYDRTFASLRGEPITLLEIGIEKGASLGMWREYFDNEQTRIIGIDYDTSCMITGEDRIETYLVDAGRRKELSDFLDEVNCQFDVIIDDGSHRDQDQQIAMAALFPLHLKPGGFYCIEDIGELERIRHPTWKEIHPSTLELIDSWHLEDPPVISDFMDDHENRYIYENIETVEWDDTRSLCIMRKKA